MKNKIDVIDVINANIEYSKKHLQEHFAQLEQSNILTNPLYADRIKKLKEDIELYEANTKTLQSLLETKNAQDLTTFYYNTYLKDYQTAIDSSLSLQREKAKQEYR